MQPQYLLPAFLSHSNVLDLYGWGTVSAAPQHIFNPFPAKECVQ